MSSESEDDFHSADEGSDVEDTEEKKSHTLELLQSRKVEAKDSSDNEETEEEDLSDSKVSGDNRTKDSNHDLWQINPELNIAEDTVKDSEETSLIGTLKHLSLQVSEQLSQPPKVTDHEDHESSNDDAKNLECMESPECKFKTFTESLQLVAEKSPSEVKNDLHVDSVLEEKSEDNQKDEQNFVESMEESLDLNEEQDNKQAYAEEFTQKQLELTEERQAIEESSHSKCANEEPSSPHDAASPKGSGSIGNNETIPKQKPCNVETIETISPETQKSKPLKASKIGMKKPREKLGERLGAKKLGSRIEKKPLEGIGPENLSNKSSEKDNTESSPQEQKVVSKDPLVLNQAKAKQSEADLWKLEEQRWQEVQGQNGKQREADKADDGWGASWGGWGTTLMSAASTFTHEVGRGVGSIMETVESSLGVPDPETLAKEVADREKQREAEFEATNSSDIREEKSDQGKDKKEEIEDELANDMIQRDFNLGGLSSFGSLVSGVSGVFETASTKVLLGGLDTLEVIGRKAMDVIQDGDPGLRKKRAFLTNAKPNLSEALKEARQKAAEEEKDLRDGGQGKLSKSQGPTFDQAWEATEGPVHLEAVSLVARQCESKMFSMLQNLPQYLVDKIQAINMDIKNACELEEESILEGDFISHVEEIVPLAGLPVQSHKITTAWSHAEEMVSLIRDAGTVDCPTAERETYAALAALVAQVAAVYHKGAELSLITPEADPLTVATQFRELGSVVCGGIENKADEVCSIITTETSAANPQVNNSITNIYLQSANGNGYIQQSLSYVASVLQYSNTKQMAAEL